MMDLYIVILASGIGKRFGEKTPKQLIRINNQPLIEFSLKTAFSINPTQIILTYPPGMLIRFKKILKAYSKSLKFVEGGERRQDSVKNALNAIDREGIVLIHDSARPLASANLFRQVYHKARQYGAAIPVIPIPDTVKEVKEDRIIKTLNRDRLFLAQTPQGFRISLLKSAFDDIDDSFTYTDEAFLFEKLGKSVYTVKGERNNLKLTFKEDLDIIKSLISL